MSGFDPFSELPEGFAMALSQKPEALDVFGQLQTIDQSYYLELARRARSHEEMRALVNSLSQRNGLGPM